MRLYRRSVCDCLFMVLVLGYSALGRTQTLPIPGKTSAGEGRGTTQEYNQKLEQLSHITIPAPDSDIRNYRIGEDDLLEVSVFDAPDLNRTVRVSADGNISLPLLGRVRAAGLTPVDLEAVLEELLRRTYMKEPHVSIFLKEVQSHAVSVFGAVKKPGVFHIRGSKTLVEMLSMAEGLADDAGDTVIVMRSAGPQSPPRQDQAVANERSFAKPLVSDHGSEASGVTPGENATEINIKNLLESGDPKFNVIVNPGDVVKVTRAGVVYVVGEVKKPGGYTLKTNENISVLQAMALAEGLTRTSAKAQARIIRTDELTGARAEIPIDLGKILAGKAADPQLRPKDIVFVPNSTGKSALYKGSEAAISIAGGVIIYRR